MIKSKKEVINKKIPQDIQIPNDYATYKQNIKYGSIEEIEYKSKNQTYKAQVLLPVNYNPSISYPTLYLLSGIGNNYEWINIGHANWIIGNLGNEIIDLIIVMPQILTNTNEDLQDKIKDYKDLEWKLPDLINKIEFSFNVLKGRENRSIAGLSMGGMSALYLSYIFDKTPYAFETTGAISPSATLFEWWLGGKEELAFSRQDNDYNFYLATGTKDAILIQGAKRYQQILKQSGFNSSFVTIENKGHDWTAFNPLFYTFLKFFFNRQK